MRVAAAVAVMALLTGGALWFVGTQQRGQRVAGFEPTAASPPGPTTANAVMRTISAPADAPDDDARTAQGLLAEAAKSIERAAAAGVPDSQYELGVMYERGVGVPQDVDRAIALYHRAAEQGQKQAAARLSELSLAAPAAHDEKIPRLDEFTTVGAEAPTPRALVSEIQRLLSRLDFDAGDADGVMGKKTTDAISAYQRMAGMTVDGKPSAALVEELREVAGRADR
jgi:TPR repeat protein